MKGARIPRNRNSDSDLREKQLFGRNTLARGHTKCSSTSVNVSVWAPTLKLGPAGFCLCSFCGLASAVGMLGKPILKQCLRLASTETDGIFYQALSVVFI